MFDLIYWLCGLTCVHQWDELHLVNRSEGVRRCEECGRNELLNPLTGKWEFCTEDERLRFLLRAATKRS